MQRDPGWDGVGESIANGGDCPQLDLHTGLGVLQLHGEDPTPTGPSSEPKIRHRPWVLADNSSPDRLLVSRCQCQ
jgi:hypothetical protein